MSLQKSFSNLRSLESFVKPGGNCPGGKCPGEVSGGKCPGRQFFWEGNARGGTVRGGIYLEPVRRW